MNLASISKVERDKQWHLISVPGLRWCTREQVCTHIHGSIHIHMKTYHRYTHSKSLKKTPNVKHDFIHSTCGWTSIPSEFSGCSQDANYSFGFPSFFLPLGWRSQAFRNSNQASLKQSIIKLRLIKIAFRVVFTWSNDLKWLLMGDSLIVTSSIPSAQQQKAFSS